MLNSERRLNVRATFGEHALLVRDSDGALVPLAADGSTDMALERDAAYRVISCVCRRVGARACALALAFLHRLVCNKEADDASSPLCASGCCALATRS